MILLMWLFRCPDEVRKNSNELVAQHRSCDPESCMPHAGKYIHRELDASFEQSYGLKLEKQSV